MTGSPWPGRRRPIAERAVPRPAVKRRSTADEIVERIADQFPELREPDVAALLRGSEGPHRAAG